MQTYSVLILTDHTTHSSENSLYQLALALRQNQRCKHIDIASRGSGFNQSFFAHFSAPRLFVRRLDNDFRYHEDGRWFAQKLQLRQLEDYDIVFLRLPHPIRDGFWGFLQKNIPEHRIINRPSGILIAGNKEFLLRFPALCPPMQLCHNLDEVADFKKQFPIVLKPVTNYGGKGILRIDGDTVWEGNQRYAFSELSQKLTKEDFPYLGMQFLKNVQQGDKRIVVVNGKIIGASLRLPAKDSWLCNASQGGTSSIAAADNDEKHIVKTINPHLQKMGIVMYGIDTLVDDAGKRILSEINALSIGGLIQMQQQTGQPLVQKAADQIWQFIAQKNKATNDVTGF